MLRQKPRLQSRRGTRRWRPANSVRVCTPGAARRLAATMAAFQFRLDWFREPTRVLGAGATSAELLRWASVLDLIGYYLATAVLAYVLWQWLRPRLSLIHI